MWWLAAETGAIPWQTKETKNQCSPGSTRRNHCTWYLNFRLTRLILNFWPPETHNNKLCCFKPPILWLSATIAIGNEFCWESLVYLKEFLHFPVGFTILTFYVRYHDVLQIIQMTKDSMNNLKIYVNVWLDIHVAEESNEGSPRNTAKSCIFNEPWMPFSTKRNPAPWKNCWSKFGARNVQDEPGTPCHWRK